MEQSLPPGSGFDPFLSYFVELISPQMAKVEKYSDTINDPIGSVNIFVHLLRSSKIDAMCNFLEPPTLREASYAPTPLQRGEGLRLGSASPFLGEGVGDEGCL